MIASERVLYIMKCIKNSGIVNIKDIAKDLNISETTVRRDFEKLEKEGKLVRVQGGAMGNGGTDAIIENAEVATKLKTNYNNVEKDIVARYAAEQVKDGECIFLDDGTSVLSMLKYLSDKRIQIVTNSAIILNKFKKCNAELFFLGGEYKPESCLVNGVVTTEILSRFYFDRCFMGCFGLSLEKNMVYTTILQCIHIKKMALENSRMKYLLVDHSKLSRNGFLQFCSLSSFDQIVCDETEKLKNTEYNNFVQISK